MEISNYKAELGRTGGGYIQMTTKSGTNQFHGSLYEFLRNDKLDARNFFAASKPITGQTGSWFSELLPNTAEHADHLCWLRGLHTDNPTHPQAVVQLHTGRAKAAATRPSVGAWLLSGLGTENQDLPGFA